MYQQCQALHCTCSQAAGIEGQGYPQQFIDMMLLFDTVTSTGPLMRQAAVRGMRPGALLASYGDFAPAGERQPAACADAQVGLTSAPR